MRTLMTDWTTRVLLIGHTEVDERATSESTCGYTEVAREHAALENFLKKRGCIIESGTVCDTVLKRSSCETRIESFLEGTHHGLRILCFLGDGSEETGAWCFAEGEQLEFSTIINTWNCIERSSEDMLLVYSDSCYSGHLCQTACCLEANVSVQASCAAKEEALENEFIAMWIRAQQEVENSDTIVRNFEKQNQQTVLYYAPRATATKFLECGTLKIQLLGQRVTTSGTDDRRADTGNAAASKSRGQDVFEMLPSDLRLVVAELTARPGWSLNHPDVLAIVEGIHKMCQQETRRGGNDLVDISDLLELLEEFRSDPTLSPSIALAKFNEEFN